MKSFQTVTIIKIRLSAISYKKRAFFFNFRISLLHKHMQNALVIELPINIQTHEKNFLFIIFCPSYFLGL